MICIYRTENILHAEIMNSRLEDCGISSYLKSNDASGELPQLRAIHPVEIFVAEEDVERVKEALELFSNPDA